MPVNFKINNHVIMPFGCEKWNIDEIKVVGVSENATFFSSRTKCAYIDKTKSEPLRLSNFKAFFPQDESMPIIEDPDEALEFILAMLKEQCMLSTKHEKDFLDLYFKYIRATGMAYVSDDSNSDFFSWWEQSSFEYIELHGLRLIDDLMLFLHLMPFPQAHIYVDDPFSAQPINAQSTFSPNRMIRVDFAFWTGKKLVAIEIDGSSHIGSRDHVERDRLLLRSGIHVIHILNEELDKYGTVAIERLLLPEIVDIDYIGLIKELGADTRHPIYEPVNSLFNPFSQW